MEVSVKHAVGIPTGSIMSVRAGTLRRQGTLQPNKPMRFNVSPADACPFVIDLYAPIASTRITLLPTDDITSYDVPLEEADASLQVVVKGKPREEATDKVDKPTNPSPQRKKHSNEAEQYVEKHNLTAFVQNLMQSVLRERPEDPFAYMQKHLDAVTAVTAVSPSTPLSPSKPAAGSTAVVPVAASKETPKESLRPLPRDWVGPAFVVQNGSGEVTKMRELTATDLAAVGSTARRLKVCNLSDTFASQQFESPLMDTTGEFQDENSWVSQSVYTAVAQTNFQMMRAGPRRSLHFDPKDVVATIVTCGGLCPGLNTVIREIVMMLYMYGVQTIYGICGGYKGVTDPDTWIELTPETVLEIHNLGGTILKSDRGNPPVEEQAKALMERGVRQHFVIGGDGTHRGAFDTFEAMRRVGWECTVVGVPKTIDNDVPMLDKTFGFDTAVTEAVKSIMAAYTEATCNANCIGLVKVMGRHCGFIAQNACLAARNVDICLLPEMDISLDKVITCCLNLMQEKGHAVIVVAEGCGDTLLKSSGDTDAGGNVKLADVGPWLRDRILSRFKEVKLPLTIKYIDPTYMIRAVRPNAYDSVYCSVLAQNAVHAAMAGYTGVTMGRVQQRYVMLPIQAITQQKPKRVDLSGRWFARLLATTQQPSFEPDDAKPAQASSALFLPGLTNADDTALLASTEPVDLLSSLRPEDEVRRLELEHLSTRFGKTNLPTTLYSTLQGASIGFIEEGSYLSQTLGNVDPAESTQGDLKAPKVSFQMVQSGPRRLLHFDPANVVAAIVTCGGLCPGLNSVVRELVFSLYAYGVKKVYGIKGGFKGVVLPRSWSTLTPENCKFIHTKGGTILTCDRGNPPHLEMAQVLKSKGVNQFFVIGGDGTHRGAYDTYEAMTQLNWECSVVGIPKTIDNDIATLDRTFGFNTAVTEAMRSIDSAFVEATCNANCIGLVRLMGRHCGYLAMMAVLAARNVDICLLPEMDISLEKVLGLCEDLLQSRGYAVVVVAEGCGDTLLKSSGEADAGGNKKLPDVGPWLKNAIENRFKKLKLPLTVKYIDPTYAVRAIPANPNDSVYCTALAQGAVHGAMAGYTGLTVAKVDERIVYLPIRVITSTPNRKVDVRGRWFERLLATTGQPNLSVSGVPEAHPLRPTTATAEGALRARRRRAMTADEENHVPDTELVVFDGSGRISETRRLERNDLLKDGVELMRLTCFHLSERFGEHTDLPNSLKKKNMNIILQDHHSWVSQSMQLANKLDSGFGEPYYQMVRGGARSLMHFDPHDPAACAAIVSCGGICPGLNSVIREVVMMLWAYGVRRIYGIKGGFKGVVDESAWIRLTPDVVKNIHMQGGSMLVSDRGNPQHADIAEALKKKNVRQYFVLGGDGTHKGAMQSFEACLDIDHECAVVGVPKTIDNDVPILDQTFGFDTACTEAVKAVESAYVEATCNANAIGLVKLMGRHCGFIAMYATLAARNVDICLIPEMQIDVEKVLQHIVNLMQKQKYAVIVVAEGCGDTLIQSSGETDAGGNKVLADAGLWLKATIAKRFKQLGMPLTIKYIDPTYMIRSVPANAFDSSYCASLAQIAVHGVMAGYSGITVGKVSEQFVYLPIHAITMQSGRRVNPNGRWFARLMETTRQPDFRPDGYQHPPENDSKLTIMRQLSQPRTISNLLQPGDRVHRLDLMHLGSTYPSANVKNEALGVSQKVVVDANAWASKAFRRHNFRDDRGHTYCQMLLSGPREYLHFEPSKCKAVIVTCGGLCPGLNSVIRSIVMTLLGYGVPKVYGCKGGYKGMVEPQKWIELTETLVQDIHNKGGSILVSDRGNPPHEEIANVMKTEKVTHCFVLGGEGTHAGAMQLFEAMMHWSVGHECAVVGVPKTIDNDIPVLDRSFGFNTASTEATKCINAACVESASCSKNCVSLVKLMGRHCGFITMEAVFAARHVDMVLLPEMNLSLPRVLTYALELIKTKGRAVIVVAEGCGDTLIQGSGETDAGGNKLLADVGLWLKAELEEYFKKMQVDMTLMYFDPTYMIRAVSANANDSVLCSVLGQHAVHGAMAGYSGFTVGKVDERYVMLPIHAITKSNPPRRVDLGGPDFTRLLATTRQPNLAPGPGDDWALMPPSPPPRSLPIRPDAASFPVMDISEWRGAQQQTADPPPVEIAGCKLKVFDGYGSIQEERQLRWSDIAKPHVQVRKLEVMRLSDRFPSKRLASPVTGMLQMPLMDDASLVTEPPRIAELLDESSHPDMEMKREGVLFQTLHAGAREYIHFDPKDSESCAAIVTCGHSCPGMNAAIRELVHTLYRYGQKRVYGIKYGFSGVVDQDAWMQLTFDTVQDIHAQGGTFLACDNRWHNPEDTALALKARKVTQFFALGGDGTLKGVMQIITALAKLEHECACIGIPATVDNNIPFVDSTFGFDTACTVARNAINAAYVEATCNANCIGLVKLTGQQSGFLAMHTALASRHVDICLIAEMEISPDKLMKHCEHLMATKGYAVILVGEHSGDSLFRLAKETDTTQDVGPWLKDRILAHFKSSGKPLTIKYIDPSHMVRSSIPSAYDSTYSSTIAEDAVHAAMAGFTGVAPVKFNRKHVYIPLHTITMTPRAKVNVCGRWFQRLLFSTKQPGFEPDGFKYPITAYGDVTDILMRLSFPGTIDSAFNDGSEVLKLQCANLGAKYPPKNVDSTVLSFESKVFKKVDRWVTECPERRNAADTAPNTYVQLLRTGPCSPLHFDPNEAGASAAIVTCGGLCPGLNSVIRELVLMLQTYGVKTVYGIKGGYSGCVLDDQWVDLTGAVVQDIHMLGGSVLVSDRGNPPHDAIAKVLQKRKVRQFFVLGGDGTHQGAMQTFEAMTALDHECAVVGVPKTIDNDIQLLDRSFGFDTACTEALNAIESAYAESATNANCIGLVKLMGRHCGWIALTAALAARTVDICLIPEMNISLPKVLAYIADIMKRKKRAVIVVAEGCGDTIIQSSGEKDAGGNAVLADVGIYLKEQITLHCKVNSIPVTIKYIDPTYMIRSVPANAKDSEYASMLAQNAVHAAMAGFTGVTCGKVSERFVMLPIHAIVNKGSRKVDLGSRAFERLMTATMQPSFAP